MAKTIKIVDGRISLNRDTGQVDAVESINKSAQDVARHVLTKYQPFFDEGSEIIDIDGKANLQELTVQQYIYDAVNRLIFKQSQNFSEDEDRVEDVIQLLTRTLENGNLVFYLIVKHSSGDVVELVEVLSQGEEEVQLNHLIDPGVITEV